MTEVRPRSRHTAPVLAAADLLKWLYVGRMVDVVERAYIHWVLQAEDGNKTRAAEVLGIDPSTLYRKISRYGLGDS